MRIRPLFIGVIVQAIISFYDRRFNIFLIAALALSMWYAFHPNPILIDDSFISFRYARNLVEGNGLVWNPGERVEGYSNFLWVMLYALGFKLGIQPETFTYILAVPLHLACLIITWLLAMYVLRNRSLSLVILLLVGFNHSVAGFAGSGMETPLQLLEYLTAAYILCIGADKGWTVRRTLLLSLLLNLSILTRPDSLLLAGGAIIGWLLTHRNRRPRDYIALLLPFLLIVAPWLIWKQTYYGTLVPNSFNAKVRDLTGFGFGLYYVYLFVIYYTLIPFLLVVIWRGRTFVRRNRAAGYLAVFALIWTAYVISVGGDFMEFRFLAPVIPFIMIAIIAALREFIPDRRILAAVIVALCLGTVNNFSYMSSRFYSYRVERVEGLRGHLYSPSENWVAIGRRLHDLFGGTDVTLALGAAGAIPYYSGLPSVDFMGLTDKTIPEIGEPFSSMPGHRIIAPLEYLVNRKVNLIVQPIQLMFMEYKYHLFIRLAKWDNIYQFFMDIDKPINGAYIDEVTLIGIPVEQGYYLVAWYLTPHEAIERAIDEYGWRRIKLRRTR